MRQIIVNRGKIGNKEKVLQLWFFYLVIFFKYEKNCQIFIAANFWTSGIQTGDKYTFEWATGKAFTYTNWYPGHPNEYNFNQECIQK